MHRLYGTLAKEFKILIKDKTGLTILFAMPMILVVIMTLIQHQAYKSLKESGIPVLLVNKDRDLLGQQIEAGFKDFAICKLTVDHGENYKDEAAIKKAVLNGDFLVALTIPEDATESLRGNITKMMDVLFQDSVKQTGELTQVNFQIISDPIAKESIVMAISSGLKEFVSNIETKVLFELLSARMGDLMGSKVDFPDQDFFSFKETYALPPDKDEEYEPNAVQHNIPAWSIFSIFFIILPLAASIINERSEGLFIRLKTFPGSYLSILSGKLLLYLMVAFIQFAIVLLLGKFLFPSLGLPELEIGNHWFALVFLTFTVSLAAVGYGLLVGTLFDTPPQSAIFGGISVLIMSALGGIWVPVNIMPEGMKAISRVVPLNWALTGYYELFIKGGDWLAIQGQVWKLGIFFIVCLLIAYRLYLLKRKFH